jgi:hypothetical protein
VRDRLSLGKVTKFFVIANIAASSAFLFVIFGGGEVKKKFAIVDKIS